jgi:sterol desaturase/sphingolipid hydroxylase (fatty acid hydroxylase superfamily)
VCVIEWPLRDAGGVDTPIDGAGRHVGRNRRLRRTPRWSSRPAAPSCPPVANVIAELRNERTASEFHDAPPTTRQVFARAAAHLTSDREPTTGMVGALRLKVPPLNFLCIYFGLGLIATVWELARPARKLRYWAGDAVLLDIAAWFFLMYVVDRYANFLKDHIFPIQFKPTQVLLSFPVWLRVAVYYVIGDMSTYWIHRLNHTRYFWRVHHFHHSITQMYWLSGARDTVFQQLLSNTPYILWAPLLAGAPHEVFVGLTFVGVMTNHWMHMNVTWGTGRVATFFEYIFVTPRTHLIHHSSAPEHYNKNFGVVFSMWDHLWGTFVSPDKTAVKEVGAGKLENPVQAAWLMTGILDGETTSWLRSKVRRLVPYL